MYMYSIITNTSSIHYYEIIYLLLLIMDDAHINKS